MKESPPETKPPRPKSRSKMHSPATSRWDPPVLLALAILTFYLEHAAPRVRAVNLEDPSFQHPHLADIVSTLSLILCSLLIPLIVLLLLHVRQLRTIAPLLSVFLLGLLESTVITVFLTNCFKLLIGRPRPYFATVCESYAPHAENLCTGDAGAVAEARKSFPSGHSSLAFSAAVYLAFYLAMKIRLADPRVPAKTARFLVVLLPVMAAALVAASRTIDYHHHYSDVIAGSLLGASVAAGVAWNRWIQLEKIGEEVVAGPGMGYDPLEESEV